jgi:phosphate transport system permease protein
VVIGLIGLAVFVDGGIKIGYSLIGGGLSLAFMILPWNIRVAEEAIKAVPATYREASFALGATKWQTVRLAVLFAALPGVITGILLGGGAALGETVVVWLTAGDAVNVSNFNISQLFNLHQAIPTLTVFIWRAPTLLSVGAGLAKSGSLYNYFSVAFAAALVLIAIYLAICFLALILRNYLNKRITGN